jgi:hypothetical protein
VSGGIPDATRACYRAAREVSFQSAHFPAARLRHCRLPAADSPAHHRLPARRESGPARAAARPAPPPHRRPTQAARCQGPATRPCRLGAHRNARLSRHPPPLVPRARRSQVRRLRAVQAGTTADPLRLGRARAAHGARQPNLGLHARPRRSLQSRTRPGSLHHPGHPQRRGHRARSGPQLSRVVGSFPQGAR